MKKLLALLFAAALLSALHADAQSVSGMANFVKGTSGAAYVGPCDLGITCTNAWGAELMRAAYSGHALQGCAVSNIVGGSCTSTFNIDFDGNGQLSSSQLTSAGCTTDTSCRVGILYHQTTSGCDLSVGGNYNDAPLIHVSTTENGHPAIYSDTNAKDLTCTDTISATSVSIMAVGTSANSGTNAMYGATDGTNATRLLFFSGFNPTPLVFQLTGTGNTPTSGATAPGGIACLGGTNGASVLNLIIQGVAHTGTIGTANTGTTMRWVLTNDTAQGGGWLGETDAMAVFVNSISNANMITIGHAMGAFWAASNPC